MSEAKPKSLQSYSKEVLVKYLQERMCFVDLKRLEEIELDLAYHATSAKLQALLQEQSRVSLTKRPDLYYALRRRIDALETRADKLFKRLMKSLEG